MREVQVVVIVVVILFVFLSVRRGKWYDEERDNKEQAARSRGAELRTGQVRF
jgi:hypothetical protein